MENFNYGLFFSVSVIVYILWSIADNLSTISKELKGIKDGLRQNR